jgi:glyoxylase-like metal-dependent hydrolase (beta-lactamase superfamily II)
MDIELTEVASGVHHARAKHVTWTLVVDGDSVTLVDTGYPGDRDRLIRSLDKIGRAPADVAAVVLTHGHPDHIGSAEYLRTAHGVPVWVHGAEAANARGEHIEQATPATVFRYAWHPSVLVWALEVLRLGVNRVERLRAVETYGQEPLDVPGRPVPVATPGHTSGHCSLHLPDRGVLLTGDALMTGHAVFHSEGPQLLPGFFNTDTQQARASLERLRGLAADAVVPGHGPVFGGTPEQAVRLALEHG